jgi:hypothetical protein
MKLILMNLSIKGISYPCNTLWKFFFFVVQPLGAHSLQTASQVKPLAFLVAA